MEHEVLVSLVVCVCVWMQERSLFCGVEIEGGERCNRGQPRVTRRCPKGIWGEPQQATDGYQGLGGVGSCHSGATSGS